MGSTNNRMLVALVHSFNDGVQKIEVAPTLEAVTEGNPNLLDPRVRSFGDAAKHIKT